MKWTQNKIFLNFNTEVNTLALLKTHLMMIDLWLLLWYRAMNLFRPAYARCQLHYYAALLVFLSH